MKNIKELYKQHCLEYNIEFQDKNLSVLPYNDTTLFCPAGIQQFNHLIKTEHKQTISNIQPCIRLNDINEIGDGSHLLYFNMIGLFSFRELTIKQAIDFWMDFLINKLELKISKITIHPDKKDWRELYSNYKEYYLVELDKECFWSDGVSEGYCTEFYVNDLEIGNIVNPNGDCIDVGFGLERLEMIVNNKTFSEKEVLKSTILQLINSNILPSNKLQGYVLRKLIRSYYKKYNELIKNNVFELEIEKYETAKKLYLSKKDNISLKGKTSDWWFDTYGFRPEEF